MNEKVKVTLDEYQDFTPTTWHPAEDSTVNELRIHLGITGERGEIAELVKKWYRDGGDPDEFRTKLSKEIGDLLYYISQLANFHDLRLSDIVTENVLKLSDRQERGVIHGSGDER